MRVSIVGGPDSPILVVDGQSKDGTAEWAKEQGAVAEPGPRHYCSTEEEANAAKDRPAVNRSRPRDTEVMLACNEPL